MKIAKSLVALTLCFCLVVVLSNSVLVEAKHNHSSFIKKAERKLKKNKAKRIEVSGWSQGFNQIFAYYKKTSIYIDLIKNAKTTKECYINWLNNLSSIEQNYDSFTRKKIDKNTVWMTDRKDGFFECIYFKKNVKKCRIYTLFKVFKHKPKAKKLRKIKKSIIKIVNSFDRL